MKATIVKIGNSKGIRIPRALLEESGLGGEVEIKASKGVLKITKLAPKTKTISPEYGASLGTLRDWDTPEEDNAWASLQ